MHIDKYSNSSNKTDFSNNNATFLHNSIDSTKQTFDIPVEPYGDTLSISQDSQKKTLPTSKYSLSSEDLKNAPAPTVEIAGEEQIATIVVDVKNNKLYRYNENGEIVDGYIVTTGSIKNGKSITPSGIRIVNHIESYPYKSATGTKRKQNPGAYGPNVLYLTIVDTKNGDNLGPDGVFIHGNCNESELGKHASHGCVRLPNDIVHQFAQEIQQGAIVKIIND